MFQRGLKPPTRNIVFRDSIGWLMVGPKKTAANFHIDCQDEVWLSEWCVWWTSTCVCLVLFGAPAFPNHGTLDWQFLGADKSCFRRQQTCCSAKPGSSRHGNVFSLDFFGKNASVSGSLRLGKNETELIHFKAEGPWLLWMLTPWHNLQIDQCAANSRCETWIRLWTSGLVSAPRLPENLGKLIKLGYFLLPEMGMSYIICNVPQKMQQLSISKIDRKNDMVNVKHIPWPLSHWSTSQKKMPQHFPWSETHDPAVKNWESSSLQETERTEKGMDQDS